MGFYTPRASVVLLLMLTISVYGYDPNDQDAEQQTTLRPINEKDVELVHVLQPGEREYLSPNLIGLQNIAMLYLPPTMTFVNIIDAYREIINGVRYEILLNAVENENKTEVVCSLVIIEKPWLRTFWGDKVRYLRNSNCSNANDNEVDATSAPEVDHYMKNERFFAGGRKELSVDEIKALEAQIHPGDSSSNTNVYFTSGITNRVYTTTNPTTITEDKKTDEQHDDVLTTSGYFNQDEDEIVTTSPSTPTTSANELSDFEKKWFDEFFLLGANNFEASFNTSILPNNDSETRNDDEYGVRNKRSSKPVKANTEFKGNLGFNTIQNHNENSSLNEKEHQQNLMKIEHLFTKFQIKYKRRYRTAKEKQLRFRIFKRNLEIINQLNLHEMGSAKYGITPFADFTNEEYKQRNGLLPRRNTTNTNAMKMMDYSALSSVQLPTEFDWRQKGVISNVKNQGNCGSCWAFSVVGNIEGLHSIKTGISQEYSEQELLDCDTSDSACQGGLPDTAYRSIMEIGGLEFESEYPYEARKKQCRFNKTKIHVRLKGYIDLPKNETTLAQWLITNGPIAIGINANAMQFYRGGVSHPWKPLCSAKNLDHGVLIVGYGESDYPMFHKKLPYWIIKNSWGSKWGEQGYYRVYRGDNTCGVSEMASSALLADE